MAEEASENQAAVEEVDYKAKYEAMKSHAREWEKKAKENQGAASELEKLKEEQLSEIEKAQNRAKEAESKLSEYEAFWSSDILTGNQTSSRLFFKRWWFWSSDILTGNQTQKQSKA